MLQNEETSTSASCKVGVILDRCKPKFNSRNYLWYRLSLSIKCHLNPSIFRGGTYANGKAYITSPLSFRFTHFFQITHKVCHVVDLPFYFSGALSKLSCCWIFDSENSSSARCQCIIGFIKFLLA